MEQNKDLTLDLEKIIASKGGHFPGFVVRWLKKFLHIDFINTFLERGYEGVEFCNEVIRYLNVTLEVEGLENLPIDGHYTFASNHPLGGIDGVALGGLVGEKFDGHIRYLVNDILMNIKGLAPISVGINKIGGQGRELPRLIDEAFKSDGQMVIFPAGLCSRKIDGRIQDIPWTKTFIIKSVANHRDIVPVHFIAENSKRFYRVAALCKKLGLKFNLAMLYLPDEMYRAQNSTFRIVFGKPISYTHFDKSKTPLEWAQWVREEVYKL